MAQLENLNKVHGGAALPEVEEVYGKAPESSSLHISEEDRIAQYAAGLVATADAEGLFKKRNGLE